MTIAPARQAQQIRAVNYGPELSSIAAVPPTGSTPLWAVSGGSVAITGVSVVGVTAMSATATTLNIGCNVAGSPSATALLNAGTLTSLAVGATVAGIPALATPFPESLAAPLAPAVPATTVQAENQNPYPVKVVITANGATITAVVVDGLTVGVLAGTYTVPAFGGISITYTGGPPTWAWTNANGSSVVTATVGNITWIASAGQTGTCSVTLNYIPLNFGATVG